MTPLARKRLFDLLRIAICVAALWLVIRGVTLDDHLVLKSGSLKLVGTVIDEGDPLVIRLADGRTRSIALVDVALDDDGRPRLSYGLKSAWRRSQKAFLFLAVGICLPVAFLQGIRLKWLLHAQNIHIGYGDGVKLSFAGNFLNFATPLGSNAGDVFKAYFVTTHTELKTEAVTTIALDRIIGLGTLVACVAAITTFSAQGSRLAEYRPYVLGVLGVGFAGACAYFSPIVRKYVIPRRLLTRLPLFEYLQRMDLAVHTLASHKKIVAAAILITLALQIMAVGAYFVVAVALALEAHAGNVLEYYAYFYTGAVIQALPGPPQGLGTVELAYLYFFEPFGSPSQIVCLAFAARVVVLVCALPGLIVTLTGSYKPHRNAHVSDT